MNASANTQIINCLKCGAKNRVAAEKQVSRAAICGRCKTLLISDAHPVIITDGNFSDEVENSPFPVLLDFWAAWCGPCRVVAPVIDQLAKELSGKVRVGKLDVDNNQMTASRFRVQSIPTLLILKNGQEVDRIVGAQSKEAILQRLRSYL
jgi:thioredoxin 2